MPLSSGDSLGPYRITALIGAGGMGRVYQAHDTALGRAVAIKVLPDEFKGDAERLARFAREAKALAALNHPHIATLYGMERHDTNHFLVMELIDGETLADRIRRGRVPTPEALLIARQIADALESAHERGIVHRDLKPANIKITPDDVVKVLDFGLAKAMDPAVGSEQSMNERANSPTLSAMATSAGIILGTAAYMSPEQAKGMPVDHRTDVFALGCVLFEMLAGRPAFDGETVTDVLASIVAREPEWNALPSHLDARVRRLLERCLAKSRRQRWQAIGDVRAEIELIASTPPGTTMVPPARLPWRRAIVIAMTGVIAASIGAAATWRLQPVPSASVMRSVFTLPDDQRFTNPGRQVLTISADGTQLAYIANARIYRRTLSSFDATAIPGTETRAGTLSPAFSPDGNAIAFWSADDQTIKRIAVAGGAAVTVCAATRPFGLSWQGDSILFGAGSAGIQRVAARGGTPETIVQVEADEVAHGPQLLPGGRAVLFTVAKGAASDRWAKARVVTRELGSGAAKVLIEEASDARYLPTGHLVYAKAGIVFAVAFDSEQLEVSGAAVPVVQGVMRADASETNTAVAQFDVSDNGTLIYVPGPVSGTSLLERANLAVLDRRGNVDRLRLPTASYDAPRVSPEGTRIAYSHNASGDQNIHVYHLSGETPPRRLTFGGRNRFPVWSADGTRIVFESDRDGGSAIYWQSADGSGAAERLTQGGTEVLHYPQAVTPNGRSLLFIEFKSGIFATWLLSVADRKLTPFRELGTSATLFPFPSARFSPDGLWIAYTAVLPSGGRIHVQPVPPTGAVYEIGEGQSPVWTADGKEIVYLLNQEFQVASVTTRPGFTVGNVLALPGPGLPAGQRNYDVLPDGRLLARLQADDVESVEGRQIRIVLNWFAELRSRVAQ